jgi:hypothetical protein
MANECCRRPGPLVAEASSLSRNIRVKVFAVIYWGFPVMVKQVLLCDLTAILALILFRLAELSDILTLCQCNHGPHRDFELEIPFRWRVCPCRVEFAICGG